MDSHYDTSDTVPYHYQTLEHDEFRLLQIHRSLTDDRFLGFPIIQARLEDGLNYEAVSHVWGDPHMSYPIALMDGSTLTVTASVGRALPHLTKACRSGYLWMDQITINQHDIEERGRQVRIMGEIYSRCTRCLIWLDSDLCLDEDYDKELDWSHGIGDEILSFFESFNRSEDQDQGGSISDANSHGDTAGAPSLPRSSPQAEPRRPSQLSGISEEPHSSVSTAASRSLRTRDHLLHFLEHPWFRRTWVYQEFVLASQPVFLMRDFELPASVIEGAFKHGWVRSASWLNTLHHRLNISMSHATMFRRAPGLEFLLTAIQSRQLLVRPTNERHPNPLFTSIRHSDGFAAYESQTFAESLERMAAGQAQDDRDHVYAFVGLAPFLLKHMTVSYTLSVEETFASMMKALIKESRSLDFWVNLPAEADVCKSHLRLPSWVSNWTVCAPKINMLCHDNEFMACGHGFGPPSVTKCKHIVVQPNDWRELQVHGRIIDQVLFKLTSYSAYQTTPSLEIDPNNPKWRHPWHMSTLDTCIAELVKQGMGDSGHSTKETLLRTLLMDGVQWAAIAAIESGGPLYRTGIERHGVSHRKKADDLVSFLVDQNRTNFDDLPHGATLNTLHDLSRVQYRRRVACCARGRLALTPDLVESGDQIAILHGSRAPVALRRRQNGKFIVLGQCFYDGAMYGEMADLDDDAAEAFTLV